VEDSVYEHIVIEDFEVYSETSFDASKLADIAKPLVRAAQESLGKINDMLCRAPALIEIVKAAMPNEVLVTVLTEDQKAKVAAGVLKLMTKKDGSLLATLVNPVTNRMVKQIPLEKIKISPEIGQAITNFSTQMQLAQIAEKIEFVQKAVEGVRLGQEADRLASAYSCQQKFLQARKIQNFELRNAMLLQIVMDAEDSRNLLMQSQRANLDYIKNQPELFWGKVFKGAPPKEIASRMNEIQDSLYAINMVSLIEAIAYQEMGEMEAARQSLKYFGEYIQSAYLDEIGFVERLDSIDGSPENYWSGAIPEIKRKIAELPTLEIMGEIGE